MASESSRPQFHPEPCDGRNVTQSLTSVTSDNWYPLIRCPANFPHEIFETAVSQLIHHPEYNSTLILRSDIVAEFSSDFPPPIPILESLRPLRCIHRKLLPRRPGRDEGLEQFCTLYGETSTDHADIPTTLVLTPIVPPECSLPYYHPTVSQLAFRYVVSEPPILQIDAIPLPNTPTDLNSRLYRTCLSLLDTLHRYGWGAMTNYKKRVIHDRLVTRESYQDLYLIMRERHRHLIDQWQESTDPLKHVYEDIGIATFLMLLWKDTFGDSNAFSEALEGSDTECPWKQWPRPSTGFLDFGCGNGLLTHILTAEGYDGKGIDLRARTSWSHYPRSTQENLHVYTFDPTCVSSSSCSPDTFLKAGIFIIGNHADELTPWLPVLSTIYSASGYLSIPCCSWAFETKYERSSTENFITPTSKFIEELNLGGDGVYVSSYSMYRIWLASLSLYCGWEVECETLRIPSTRNWAIIGRRRTSKSSEESLEAENHARDIVRSVRERGIFKSRKPEGRAGDH